MVERLKQKAHVPVVQRDRRMLHRIVAEALVDRILSNVYPENSLLPPERELCTDMGVSRTVVREAIKLLETQRLVRIEHGRGTIVQAPDPGLVRDSLELLLRRGGYEMEDLMEIRKILEVGMAALAAERRTPAHLEVMQRCLDTMRARPGEPEGYVDADVGFHDEIARAARNPLFSLLLSALAGPLRKSRLESFSGPSMVRLRIRQHEEIFDGIAKQDAARAQQAMSGHLSDTEKDLARRRKARGDQS
jgi:GntR family transcriptional repressor for pyruvate dehydrogenase complex